jgi:hypothetical protein
MGHGFFAFGVDFGTRIGRMKGIFFAFVVLTLCWVWEIEKLK